MIAVEEITSRTTIVEAKTIKRSNRMELYATKYTPVNRMINGEIAYLDDMRRKQESTTKYSQLSAEDKSMYEERANGYIERGVHPDILNDYQDFDNRMHDIDRSCIALADELLTHKHNNNLTFVDICIDQSPETVLDRLRQTRIGSILASDDEQLALESDGSYYPVLDVKKQDAQLRSVGLTVFGWDDDRYVITNDDREQNRSGHKILMYPEGEKLKRREFQLTFGYSQPDSSGNNFGETVTFAVGESGTRISRSVFISEYAETGYEGHGHKTLSDVEDADAAAIGNLMAEIVGDEPASVTERQTKRYEEYLDKIISPQSRQYIEEWVDNSWNGQVMYDLGRKELCVGTVPMRRALTMPELAEEAHETLVNFVDYLRLRHNQDMATREPGHTVSKYDSPWNDGSWRES